MIVAHGDRTTRGPDVGVLVEVAPDLLDALVLVLQPNVLALDDRLGDALDVGAPIRDDAVAGPLGAVAGPARLDADDRMPDDPGRAGHPLEGQEQRLVLAQLVDAAEGP